MKRVLLRVERLLDREKGAARRHLGAYDGGQIPYVSFPSNPMYEHIVWLPLRTEPGRSMLDDLDTHNLLEITAYGGTMLHRTWFEKRESVQLFLDVVSAQVKPGTSAEVFAEVVHALIQMQDVGRSNIVTIVGEVWKNGRKAAAEAIAPVFLADHVPDPSSPVISEAADGWVRVFICSESLRDGFHDLFVLWHLPPDVESHLTMVVASPNPANAPPPWSRLIASGAACSLLYGTPHSVVFPRQAHRGSGVTCVEYACLRGEGEYDVEDATALANLFKQDADPIVVGLGFQTLKRLQAVSPHGEPEFHPHTSTDYDWQVMWPEAYEACVQTNIQSFFLGLICIAHPWDKVNCKQMSSRSGVREYEFKRWENNDDQGGPVAASEPEPAAEPEQTYECVVEDSKILFKILSKSMRDASDAETEAEDDGDIGVDLFH
jgi:hypothetical protein